MKGNHQVKPLPFAYNATSGISEQVNKWHHDTHYAGYVKKRNEIEEKLEGIDRATANANYSEYGELKRRESFNASGMILHELYWDVLGGDGKTDPTLAMSKKTNGGFRLARAVAGRFYSVRESVIGLGNSLL